LRSSFNSAGRFFTRARAGIKREKEKLIKLEQEEFTVEKLYFQALPRVYVTANLYLPKKLEKPAPAILYVCGHSHLALVRAAHEYYPDAHAAVP
jgi:hypothetical protein